MCELAANGADISIGSSAEGVVSDFATFTGSLETSSLLEQVRPMSAALNTRPDL